MASSPNSDMSDEQIQGHWEIQARNELIVTQHQSSSSSDEDSDSNSGDGNAGKKEQYSKKERKAKKKKQQNKRKTEEKQNVDKNFNPFIDIRDCYGGQSSKLAILPRFPQNHGLAGTQRF